jgi:hypothetical protein
VHVAPVEANHAIFGMDGDSVSISVRQRRGDDWPHRHIFELSDSLEGVANLLEFNLKLMFVIDVLVCASSASAEVRTLGRYAIWRRFKQLDQFSFGELLFLAHNFGRDLLAVDRERNENRFALIPRHAFAAERDVFDL